MPEFPQWLLSLEPCLVGFRHCVNEFLPSQAAPPRGTPDSIRVGSAAVKERLDEEIKEGWKKDLVIVATKCDSEGAVTWSSGSLKQASPQGPLGGFWTAIEVKGGN